MNRRIYNAPLSRVNSIFPLAPLSFAPLCTFAPLLPFSSSFTLLKRALFLLFGILYVIIMFVDRSVVPHLSLSIYHVVMFYGQLAMSCGSVVQFISCLVMSWYLSSAVSYARSGSRMDILIWICHMGRCVLVCWFYYYYAYVLSFRCRSCLNIIFIFVVGIHMPLWLWHILPFLLCYMYLYAVFIFVAVCCVCFILRFIAVYICVYACRYARHLLCMPFCLVCVVVPLWRM